MRRGVFAKSAWKKALGTDEQPSEVAIVADKYNRKLDKFGGFMADIHASLYDPHGNKSLPEDAVNALGSELLGAAQQQGSWGELTVAARCHPLVAAEAVESLSKAVASTIGLDALSDDEDASSDPEQLERERETVQDMPTNGDPGPDGQPGQPGGFTTQEKQEALSAIDKALQKARARRQHLTNRVQQAQKNGALGRAVQRAAQQAQKTSEAVNALVAAGCGTGDGSDGKEPVTKELIAKAMSLADFGKIVDMVGKMQQAADQKAEEATGVGRLAPNGLHLSKELTDLLASEWALEDASPDAWLKRFLDGQMLGVERESPEPKAKGDVIVMVDKSGSMNGARIEWARALAFAAIQRATREGRRWVLAMYSDQGSMRYATVAGGMAKALDTLSVGASGGTDTDWAVREACTRARKDIGDLRDPDVLLITDGDWPPFSPATMAAIGEGKTRLFVVQLDGTPAKIEGAVKMWNIRDLDINTAATVLSEVTL